MNYKAPRGTVDILPEQSNKWQTLEQLIRTICANYNVKEVRTPIFEHTDLFCRSVGDTTDIVSKEMYTFADKKGRSITLRPEGTAGVARAYVEHKMYANPDKISKLYYIGPMFRYERPQNGRQRQFHQFGVEMIGYESPYLDVECMTMAVTLVKALGLKGVKLHINTLGDNESRDTYREALKAHFAPYLDELCSDCKNRYEANPLRILDCKVDRNHPAMATAPKTLDYLNEHSKAHFEKVCQLLDELEIEYVVDPNLVRGLDYYTGVVFEYHYTSKLGKNYGAIGGGGHYANLIKEIGGPDIDCVGFGLGIDRIIIAYKNENQEKLSSKIDLYIASIGDEQKVRDVCFVLNNLVRLNGLISCCNTDISKLDKHFKYAEKMLPRFIAIVGSKEVDKSVVILKDQVTKKEETLNILEFIEKLKNK